jgi:archaeosine-15-forming tRNA-guanine transglycosylase
MTLKNKIYLAIIFTLAFIGQLIFLGYLAATAVQAAEPKAALSALELRRHLLNIVSLSPVIAQGGTVGARVVYDDPSTTRPEDYVEVYDSDGELVAVGWLDQFGIQRMAIDRAFVDGGDKLEGAFVAIVDGEFI